MLLMVLIAASKNNAAEASEDSAADNDDEGDEDEDDEYDYDDDMEEDKTVRQTICDRDVDVAKLVADVEFMALVDK